MVKRSRDQSQEAPSRLSCRMMVPPDCRFHSHTRATKAVPSQILLGLALGGELALDHVLRGDPGMIGAGHPQGLEAVHPLHADQDVLQGVVQGVSHVQRARHVRRRDHDAVGLARAFGIGPEEAPRLPVGIPARLDRGGIVAIREISHERGGAPASRNHRCGCGQAPAAGRRDGRSASRDRAPPATAAMATVPSRPGGPSQAGSLRRVDGSRARSEASGTRTPEGRAIAAGQRREEALRHRVDVAMPAR